MTRTPRPQDVPTPLACMRCGQATPPERGTHPEGLWPWGWPPRVCNDCRPSVEHGLTQADAVDTLRAILGDDIHDDDPDAREVVGDTAAIWYLRHHPNASPLDPGSEQRWAHIDRTAVAEMLDHVRSRRAQPAERRAPEGGGCGACGVVRSTAWRVATFRTGLSVYSQRVERPICADCQALASLHGLGPSWIEAVAKQASPHGVTGPAFIQHFGFQLAAAAVPHDPGTLDRFGYLADLPGGDPRERVAADGRRAGAVTAAKVQGPLP